MSSRKEGGQYIDLRNSSQRGGQQRGGQQRGGQQRGGQQRGGQQRGGQQRGGQQRGGQQRGGQQRGGQQRGGQQRGRQQRGGQQRGGQQRGGQQRGGQQRGGQLRGGDERQVSHTDVRPFGETPVDRSSKLNTFPKGNEGEDNPLPIIANHYPLKIDLKKYYHYEVDIKVAEQSDSSGAAGSNGRHKMRKLAQKENFEVIEAVKNEWNDVFGNRVYVFDGKKSIHTVEKLSIDDGQKVERNINVKIDGYRERTYQVTIQFANEVDLSLLDHFYEGRLIDATYGQLQEVLQVLEIILRYIPSQMYTPVGKWFYSRENFRPIGNNAVMAFGHYQTVNITECGLTLVVDRNATLFRSSGSLVEFIAETVGIKPEKLKTKVLNENEINKINRQLRGLRIFTKHVRDSKRIETCDQLISEKANEVTFERYRNDENRRESITVQDYFYQEYNITLDYPNIPLVLLKNGNKLPVEVCYVCPEQLLPKKLETNHLKQMIVRESNSMKPIERFGFIHDTVMNIISKSKDLLKAFGVQIIEKPIKLNARQLTAPKLEGYHKRVKEGVDLNNWIFINLSPEVKDQMPKVEEFVNKMCKFAHDMGITIRNPSILNENYDSKTLNSIYTKATKSCQNLQLMMFCIPASANRDDRDYCEDSDTDEDNSSFGIYEHIKSYGDVTYGIMTQCISDAKLLDIPRGYFYNLLLKINCKLGGKNVVIRPISRSRLPIMKQELMIVGVDVTHPGSNTSGNDSRIISSIAAVVGSYDKDFIKYRAEVRVQPKNKLEVVINFDVMISELLKNYKALNDRYPESIVIYRDGVSEGQYDQVLDTECKLLFKACNQLMPNYKPKVTYCVVVKRHHTRFITFNDLTDERTGNPILNIPAGTVVDTTVVNPMHRESYLCSHKGFLGTSRPTRYVVLRDDNNMSADDNQKLSYYLCFLSGRTTKSISIPIPVQYADLAAYRFKFYILTNNIGSGGKTINETKEEREARESRVAQLLNQQIVVKDSLKNRFYYG